MSRFEKCDDDAIGGVGDVAAAAVVVAAVVVVGATSFPCSHRPSGERCKLQG